MTLLAAPGAELTVDWAPSLPAHWRATRLQRVARIYAGGTPDKTNESFWTNGTIPWLNSGAVNDAVIQQASAFITHEAAGGGRTRWAPRKSVVIALAGQGRTKGMAARLEIDSTLNQSMAAIIPSHELDYRFVHYWLLANYRNVRAMAGGDLRDGLNLQHIGSIQIPVPPLSEQQELTAFLDREVAEIDSFIGDQESLIALLTERRVATISHAVIKGLDPGCPLKDSGIEWVGTTPAHWGTPTIARSFQVTLGKMLDAGKAVDPDSVEMPYIRAANIRVDGLDLESANRMYFRPDEARSLDIRAEDLLVVEGGATVGMNVVVTEDMPRWSFQKTVNRVRALRDDSTRYLAYYLDALRARGAIEMVSSASTFQHLTAEKLERLQMPMPPQKEQRAIVEYLSMNLREIDASIADAKDAIALSRERRSALIAAAVTGKIDVREHGRAA